MTERVQGGHSLFAEEQPEKCPDGYHAHWRTVKCDNVTDVVECSRCGQQRTVACNFDDDYS